MRYYLKYTLLIWVLPLSVAAATIINVPADYSAIQAALNAAQSGDTVLVQPGTYYENVILPDVNGIKLISAGDTSNTIIDGSTPYVLSGIIDIPSIYSLSTTGLGTTEGGLNVQIKAKSH